jgi:8-oxo-dGTP pyrophosphatase MutT (NUDIX family)
MTRVEIKKQKEVMVPIPVAATLVVKYESPINYFLLSRRLTPPEVNRLSVPGGRQEGNEKPPDCARRELKEETGIIVPSAVDNFYPILHGKQIFLESECAFYCHGFVVFWRPGMETPQQLEPTKNTPWQWYSKEQVLDLQKRDQLSAMTEELFRAYYIDLFFGCLLPEVDYNLNLPCGWGQDRITPR